MDVLARLTRRDKWALGGGKGALCAPPFPRWLTTPGFWDECYLADLRIPRLFTILFIKDGRPVRTNGTVLDWNPSRLRLRHDSDEITVEETRWVTEGNAFVSELRLVRGSGVEAFLWSLLELREKGPGTPWTSLTDAKVDDGAMVARWETAWPREVAPDRTGVESEAARGGPEMLPPMPLWLAFGADAPRLSHTVNLAQRHDESPLYELSVLPDKLQERALAGRLQAAGRCRHPLRAWCILWASIGLRTGPSPSPAAPG